MADINECAECSAKTEQPLVGILMGSNSDWEVMKNAAQMLKDFGVPFEARVVSAHRMPDEMFDYAEKAAERGIRVIIAAPAALRICPACSPPNARSLSAAFLSRQNISAVSTVSIRSYRCLRAFRRYLRYRRSRRHQAALYAVQILALNNPELSSRLADFRVAQNAKARAMTLPIDELA